MTQDFSIFLFIVFLTYSCHDDCPPKTDVGQLSWSESTENWFPFEYYDPMSAITFENQSGAIKSFKLDTIGIIEGTFFSVVIPCDDGGMSHMFFAPKTLFGRFLSSDSIIIDYGVGVWNEVSPISEISEDDFYEWIVVTCHLYNDGTGRKLGRFRIVTDLRNSELDEITGQPNDFNFSESLDIANTNYTNVYSAQDPDFSESNIYFQQGKGIIAFRDTLGVLWIRN
jgi:hypothetical protein